MYWYCVMFSNTKTILQAYSVIIDLWLPFIIPKMYQLFLFKQVRLLLNDFTLKIH